MSHATQDNLRKRKNRIIRLIKQDKMTAALERLRRLRRAHAEDAELPYLEGMVHASQLRYGQAILCFNQALTLNRTYTEAQFELGVIEMTLCRFNKASHHLKQAGAGNYRNEEVDAYLSEIERVRRQADVRLSACLIVKNEETRLPGCLRSLRAVADEIVIVDTGSSDKTVAIAESFGAKVYHHEWQQDFAAARNFAIKQATGDWIIQLDADEELFAEDQYKVRELIHQDACDGAYLAIHNRVSTTFGENKPSIHYLVRLFRNRPDFYYINPIHEILKIDGEVLAVDINLLHHGYNLTTEQMHDKRERNKEILYRRLSENPDSPTTLFYLSMMHIGNREFDLAEDYAKRALKRMDEHALDKQHVVLMALNNLAMICHDRNDMKTAREYCERAIAINENFLDPYYFLGLTYYKEGELTRAQEIFTTYLDKHEQLKERPVFNLFGSSAGAYLYHVYHFLGKICRRQENPSGAESWLHKAVETNPKFWVGYVDLGYLYADQQEWQKAADSLDRAIELGRKNPEVNDKNQALWFDFTNAVKAYMKVLKALSSERTSPNEAQKAA